MRKLFTILFLLLVMAAKAQRQQISYIEETKNWYYVYDEQGKRIGGLSQRTPCQWSPKVTKTSPK